MISASAMAFSPPPAPLREVRPTIALGFLVVPAAIAMAFANPIVLAGCALAVIVMARGAGAMTALRRAALGGAALGVLIVAVNGLVVRRGDTVIFRGGELPLLGDIDVTAEAIAEGAVIAGRVVIVIAAFAVITARVDPDYLLGAIRRFAGHSALTATLLVRLVPLAIGDLTRLREARELRGPAASPVTRTAILRRLVADTLDRAVDSAAALEVRGYGGGRTKFAPRKRRDRYDRRFSTVALLGVALAMTAWIAGAGSFDAYPTVTLETGAATLAFAASIPLCAWLVFAGTTKGERR